MGREERERERESEKETEAPPLVAVRHLHIGRAGNNALGDRSEEEDPPSTLPPGRATPEGAAAIHPA